MPRTVDLAPIQNRNKGIRRNRRVPVAVLQKERNLSGGSRLAHDQTKNSREQAIRRRGDKEAKTQKEPKMAARKRDNSNHTSLRTGVAQTYRFDVVVLDSMLL